jgi:hypothetical protein
MKMAINNLLDLQVTLNGLRYSQLTTDYKIIPNGERDRRIASVEVTDEEFLENIQDEDDFGYESELIRRHGETFVRSNYKVLEGIGFVIIHTE